MPDVFWIKAHFACDFRQRLPWTDFPRFAFLPAPFDFPRRNPDRAGFDLADGLAEVAERDFLLRIACSCEEKGDEGADHWMVPHTQAAPRPNRKVNP